MQTFQSPSTTPGTRDNYTNSTTSPSTGVLPSPSTALFKHEASCLSSSIPLLSVAETEPIIISSNSINYHHSLDPLMSNKSCHDGDLKKINNSRTSVFSQFTLDPAIKEEISWLYESSLLDSNVNSGAKTPAIPVGWISSPYATVSSPPVNMGSSSSSSNKNNNTKSDNDSIAVPERSPRRLLYPLCNSHNNNSSFISTTNEGYSSANTYSSSSNTSLASMKKNSAYLNNNSTVSSFADSSSPLHHHPYHGKLATTLRQGSSASNSSTYPHKTHESLEYQPNSVGSTPESMLFNNSEFNHHSFILNSGKYPELTPLDTDKDIYSSDEADWVDVSDDDYGDDGAEIINNGQAMGLKLSSQRTTVSSDLKKKQEMQQTYESVNLEDVRDFKEPPLQATTRLRKDNDKIPKKSSMHSFKQLFKKNKKRGFKNSEKETELNNDGSQKGQLPLPKTQVYSNPNSNTAATTVTATAKTSAEVSQNDKTIEVTKDLRIKEIKNHPVSKEIKKNMFEKTNSFIVHNTYDHASRPLPPPIVGNIPSGANSNNAKSNSGSFASAQPVEEMKTNRPTSEVPANFGHKLSRNHTSVLPQPVHQQQNEQVQQKQQPPQPQPHQQYKPSQRCHLYSQLARVGQPKYQINSTPIMNNYINKPKPATLSFSNNNGNLSVYGDAQFQNSASSLSSKPTGGPLIIKVPHSLSELNSLISLNPTPVKRTPAIDVNILKSPIIQLQMGLSPGVDTHEDAVAPQEDESKRKSSQFYFVSSYESQPPKVPSKRNSKRVSFSQFPKQSKMKRDSCSTDMLPISPSLSESDSEDLKQIKEQYLSEPSTPGSMALSSRFSVNSFSQNPFRKSNNPFFTQDAAGAAVGVDASTWPADDHNVKVNDSKTVTIRTMRNSQNLGSGCGYAGGRPNSMNSITTMVEKSSVASSDMINGNNASTSKSDTTSANHSYRPHSTALSTIPDVNEELEEDAIHGAQTALIPDDDLNSLQDSLSQDYRLKKQKRVLLQLQEFDQRAAGLCVTPLKNKRMTFSLLYNSFYNQENPNNSCQKQQQHPITCQSIAYNGGINKSSYNYSGRVCHSATELKHFSKLLGSDVMNNRYRKLVDNLNMISSNDDNDNSATNCRGKLDPRSFGQVHKNEELGSYCGSRSTDGGDGYYGMKNQLFDEKYQYQQQEKLSKTLFNYVTCKNC